MASPTAGMAESSGEFSVIGSDGLLRETFGIRQGVRTFVRGLMALRAVAAAIMCISAIVGLIYPAGSFPQPEQILLYSVIALTYTGVFAVLMPFVEDLNYFTTNQLLCDVAFISTIVAQTGGIDSIFIFFFVAATLFAGATLDQSDAFLVAASICTAMTLILLLQLNGYLVYPRRGWDQRYFINMVGFPGAAFLVNILAQQLRHSWVQLAREQAEVEQLQIFNQEVISSIKSGLLTMNHAMELLTSNSAAEEILGSRAANLKEHTALQEIFDHQVAEVASEVLYGESMSIGATQRWFYLEEEEEWIFLDITCTRIQHHSEEPTGLLVTFMDRTDLKRLEQQTHDREQLETAVHLAAGMAHEIRNPLGAITMSMEALVEGMELDGYRENLFGIVKRESKRLNNLLQEFMEYTRPSELVIVETDVVQLIEDVMTMLKLQFAESKNIRFETRFHEKPLRVRADSDKIKQVIWNITLNACQIMEPGGRVSISTTLSGMPTSPLIPMAWEEEGGPLLVGEGFEQCLRIAISDTGPGISKDHLAKIFKPFQSKRAGGFGLGLAMCRKIAEAHGGTIQVSSRLGEGTTFLVFLPLVPRLTDHPAEERYSSE